MSKSRLTVFSFVRRFLLRLMVVLAVFWGGGIALFSVAPVPFSAVMVERQVSAWLHGNFRYVAHSDWVSMDQISPWMGLAVIAAEDQKFPEHWGFDVASIEKALRTTSAMKTVFAVLQRFLSRRPKISFYGMGVAGYEKGWKLD